MARTKKGRGWHKDQDPTGEGHAEAGRLGGQATYEEWGEDFFREIGSEGGKVSPGNFKNDPKRAAKAGSLGGKARAKKNQQSRDLGLDLDSDY